MIQLTVTSYNGAPCDGPSATFDELGGTVGRADNNHLVLQDPERTISRVHARVKFRSGGYVVADEGSNPIAVNGKAVGAGNEAPLKVGDELRIGGYLIKVGDARAAKADDPFADLFGDGLAQAPQAPAKPRPRTPPVVPAPSPASRGRSSAPAAGGIPEDWDPFAPEPAAEAGPSDPGLMGDPMADLVRPTSSEDSLDALFGLGATASGATDPFARVMPAPAGPPNTAGSNDPLAALGRPAAPPPATAGDLGSELNTPMPLAPKSPPAARRPVPPASPPPAGEARPGGAVFSWDEDPNVSSEHVDLGDFAPAAAPPLPPAAPPAPAVAPARPGPMPAPGQTPQVPVAGADVLRDALLEGLAAPELRLETLTPQTMRLIGRLLHEATRGTVELLAARASLKREMRAEVTMIVAKENNPLKFSPTVEVALQHLLSPPMTGFLPAAPAMRDAYDDLRAHQLGVMSGMRAALEGVLGRFDPVQLEAKIERRSALGSLIPMTRKARLWELFQELFSQLQAEAQDDFDELFGKAFRQAYDEHIARLQDEPGPD